jgi:cytochrome c553
MPYRVVQLRMVGAILATFAAVHSAAAADTAAAAFFENQVRPVLAQSCFKCHGTKKQEAGLRLDSRPALLQGGEHGPAIVPGAPDQSLLLRAVSYQSDIRMPPSGKLTDEQIAALARWLRQGAPWPGDAAAVAVRSGGPTAEERRFWSFQPVTQPPAPAVKDATWPSNDVDRFILARLEEKGWSPAPPADKRTLLRRATFDLTGLPPTPEEVADFLTDTAPDAFARVVDRLLASPHYGERWGRHWLDVVRYADTAGETADYPVPEAYRYRNYVLDAFNDDKPYDEFLREQIAGDILAGRGPRERYAERVTATGYLAIARRFGFDTEKYEHLTVQDTLDTLGQSVLGLTLGCARCHDHKFDPVSMKDYYALYGFFASTWYAFPGSERLTQARAMVPLVPPREAASGWEAFQRAQAAAEQELATLKAGRPEVTVRSLADLDGDFELQAPSMGGSRGLPCNPWQSRGGTSVTTTAQSPYTNWYRHGNNGISLPGDAADNALGCSIHPARTAADDGLYCNVDFRVTSAGRGAYRLFLGHGPGTKAAVEILVSGDTLFLRNGATVEPVRTLKVGAWYNLQLRLESRTRTFSGTVGAPGDLTNISDKAFSTDWDGKIDYFAIDSRGHVDGTKPSLDVDNVGIRGTPIPPVVEVAAELHLPHAGAAEIRQRLLALIERGPFPQAYGVVEGTAQDAHLQKRGEPTNLGEMVPRRFLDVLGGDPLPPDTDGSGRLQLAEWLTRPTNPLTARVLVNRLWQYHFGAGLVRTPNDFGTRGQRPTHPELLDYLAHRFMRGGWSIKAVHRLVMLSQTYQMSSTENATAIAADPGNGLLAYFPRRRLDAESIRDAMLALGGNLDRSPGGQHPFPPIEQCRFTQHNPFTAVYDTPRRSVYLMTQRLKRHPFLALFDGADTNASTAVRATTTVPTQALFLMNDPFVHAQSTGFARRLLTARPDDTGRLILAFKMALARPPSVEETQETRAFLDRYRELLRDAGVPPAEHEERTWSALARTLLTRNEFLFVD